MRDELVLIAERADESLSQVTDELAEKFAKQTELELELSEVNRYVVEVSDQVHSLTSLIHTMESTVTDSLHREEALQADLSALVGEYDTLVDTKTRLEEEIATLRNSISSAHPEKTNTHEDELIPSLRNAVSEANDEIARLTSELNSAKLNEATLAFEARHSQDVLRSLEAELFYSRQRQADTEARLVELSEIEQMAATVNNLVAEQQPLNSEFEVSSDEIWSLVDPEPEEATPQVAVEQGPESFATLLLEEEISLENDPLDILVRSSVERKVADRSAGSDVMAQIPGKHDVTLELPNALDELPKGSNASFGSKFPESPNKGDMFLRIDYVPSRLFKWNDSKWMPVARDSTDSYSYDEEYLKLLIAKVSTGEYDAEDLSDLEQEQVSEYLRTHPI